MSPTSSTAKGFPVVLVAVAALCCFACGVPSARVENGDEGVSSEAVARIGVVHVQQAMAASAAGQEARRLLEAQAASMRDQMADMQSRLDAASSAVEEAKARRAPRRRREGLEADYHRLAIEAQSLEAELRAAFSSQQEREKGAIMASLREVVARLGQQQDLAMVLDGATAPYFLEQFDLTEQVVAELDEATARAEIEAELAEPEEAGDAPDVLEPPAL